MIYSLVKFIGKFSKIFRIWFRKRDMDIWGVIKFIEDNRDKTIIPDETGTLTQEQFESIFKHYLK